MHILILGAGIAGAACALALQRHGHRLTLVERQPSPDTMGGGVVLWPNASHVLDQLGLLSAVAARSGTPVEMRRLDRHGKLLSALDIGQLDAAMGHASHAILRRDLQAILLTRLRELGVQVQYAQPVMSLSGDMQQQGLVHLADGRVLQADLILGAEGRMRSAARQYVTGDNTPRYQGFINWVGITQLPPGEPPLFDAPAIHDYWGCGLRFGIVPVSPHTYYWAGAQTAATPPSSQPADLQDHLARLFDAWPQAVRRVIGHSEPQALRQIAIHDHDPVEHWQRGNVLLVGDAAHAALPTSGQGACQALEDAWQLAQCLQADGSLEERLQAYTARRQPKTRQITLQARAMAQSLFQLDEAACRQRDAQARQADTRQIVRDMARAWGQGLFSAR